MLQSDGSTKLPEPPGSGSSAIKTECCPCRNAFRKEGTKAYHIPHMASQLTGFATKVCGTLYARLAPDFAYVRFSAQCRLKWGYCVSS